jgi:hypothetical protein
VTELVFTLQIVACIEKRFDLAEAVNDLIAVPVQRLEGRQPPEQERKAGEQGRQLRHKSIAAESENSTGDNRHV